MALLNCKNYQREWSAQYRERGTTYEKVLSDEAAEFGACHLEPGRLEIIIEKNRAVLQARRIEADACLLWPQAKLHMSMEMKGARTGYWRLGPDGVKTFEEGPSAQGVITNNNANIAVFESREFDVNVGGPRAQPLERSTQVGEFYGMLWGNRRTEELSRDTYRTNQRDIFIFDLPSDDYARMSFREGLLETEVFDTLAPHPIRQDIMGQVAATLNNGGGLQKKMQTYRNNISLYNSKTGESRSDRNIPVFLYHDFGNGNSNEFKIARTFGDLDYDVLTDSDVLQVAQTIGTGDILQAVQGFSATPAADPPASPGGATNVGSVFPLQVSVASSSPMTVGGHAALVSGSLPLAVAANALLYAAVGADGKVSPSKDMDNSKFSAWLKAHEAKIEKNKENDQFNTVINQRKQLIQDVLSGFHESTDQNAMEVRKAFCDAFDKNVQKNGTYASKKSFDTLKADLQRVRESASKLPAGFAKAQSRGLRQTFVSDLSENPFATATSASGAPVSYSAQKLNEATKQLISDQSTNFSQASVAMEDRVILHGATVAGVPFSEDSAAAWAAAVASEAKTSAQRASAQTTQSVAADFIASRKAFESTVQQSIQGAVTSTSSATSTDGIFTNNEYREPVSAQGNVSKLLFGGLGAERAGLPFDRLEVNTDGSNISSNKILREAKFSGNDAALAFLNAPITGEVLLAMADNNIHIPFNLLLWRLWIQLKMFSGILMQSGYQTGASVYGNTNFAIQEEVATKTLLGNFTFYHNAIVWREQAVMHLRNICFRGYEGGWSTRYYSGNKGMAVAGDEEDNTTGILYELYEVPARQRGSVLSTLIAVTENRWNGPLNFVRGQRVFTETGEQVAYTDRVNLFDTYSGQLYYALVHGITDSMQKSQINASYLDEYGEPNTIAHMGAHYVYNSNEKKFNLYRCGTGHLSGNRTGRGVKAVVQGSGRLLPDQESINYVLN